MASTGKTDRIQGVGASEEDVPKFENNSISRDEYVSKDSQPINSLIADPPIEFTLQVGSLEARVRTMEAQLKNLMDVPKPAVHTETIAATMVGGIFNCPECGLRITSPALIATQGLKTGGYYEHPFDDSPRLAGGKCRLIGKKFKSPIVHLEFVPVVAPKKVDIQETIGV